MGRYAEINGLDYKFGFAVQDSGFDFIPRECTTNWFEENDTMAHDCTSECEEDCNIEDEINYIYG